jgi:photosystem II stability/assembly factor-like uncharacterized protein
VVIGWGTKARLLAALSAAALVLPGHSADGAAGVSVGHSGWEWSNPLPQGNSIRSLDFIGASGYAAGDFGTVLRTDDSGATFSAVASGLTEDLVRVRMIDLDSLVIAGGCALRRSDDAGSSFRRLDWAADSGCRSPLASIAFPSGSVGYVLQQDGRVHRTADGGESWLRMASLPGGDRTDERPLAADILFTAEDIGLATTRDGIYRTSDGAFSWTRVASRPKGLEGLFFATDSIGYAVGDSIVLKSTDGGESWSDSSLGTGPASLPLRTIDCSSAVTCIATADGDQRIVRTIDGGGSWSAIAGPSGPVLTAAFSSPSRALAGGVAGITAVSDDGGASWSRIGGALTDSFNRLSATSGTLAFAIGDRGVLARTTDGGDSWSNLPVPTSDPLIDVAFLDETYGFVLDGAGTLFRTEDGGAGWQALHSSSSAPPEAVLAMDPDLVLLVGPRGIRRSLDGGRSFTAASRRAVRRAVLFDADYAGGSLFAYGPTSLFASRDRGRTWRKLERPDHRPLAIVDFVGERVGFALGKGGRVWRTGSRGRSWRELRAGTDGGTELAFRNAREGYLASDDLFFARGASRPDYLLRTSDGGRTWRPQLVSGRNITGLAATRASVDFLLAGGNQLFSTASGGDRGRRSMLRITTTKRRLARARSVAVKGRLRPAEGGEQVIVSMTAADPRLRQGSTDWNYKTARVAADGSFTTIWKVRKTSVFVAQWPGDGVRRSAGSKAVKVRMKGVRGSS